MTFFKTGALLLLQLKLLYFHRSTMSFNTPGACNSHNKESNTKPRNHNKCDSAQVPFSKKQGEPEIEDNKEVLFLRLLNFWLAEFEPFGRQPLVYFTSDILPLFIFISVKKNQMW